MILIPLTHPRNSDNCRTKEKETEVYLWLLNWIYYFRMYFVKKLFFILLFIAVIIIYIAVTGWIWLFKWTVNFWN